MYTILICDDDRDIVSALDIYLTSEGYQTIKAYNGREALRAAEEKLLLAGCQRISISAAKKTQALMR